MFDRILIAVDGSDCAKRAARVGFDVAATCEATVDVVLAVEPGSPATEADSDEGEAAAVALDEAAELGEGRGVGITAHLIEGRPFEAILDVADREAADLIVMGREGRAGLAERLLGSTTERVLRRASVPVLVVPESDSEEVGAFRNVLVTTDGSDVAEAAGPYAGELAPRYDAAIHLLTVVDVQDSAGLFDAGGVSKAYVERLEAQGQAALERLDEAIGHPDLDRREAVVRGVAHEAIAEYAAAEGIDLVVVASAGQASLGGQHLGSTAGRVLRTVDVPVLVVTTTD